MLKATGQTYSNMAGHVHGKGDPHHLPERCCSLVRRGQRRGMSHQGLSSTKVCSQWHGNRDQTFSTSSFFLITYLPHFAQRILFLCHVLSHTHTYTHSVVSHPYRLQHPLRGLWMGSCLRLKRALSITLLFLEYLCLIIITLSAWNTLSCSLKTG